MQTVANTPRIGTPRNPDLITLGGYFDEISNELGFNPHGWQSHLNDVSTQLDMRRNEFPGQSSLKFHAQHIGCLVGRQTGKTAWAVSRVVGQALLSYQRDIAELVGLDHIKPQKIIYTAQRRVHAVERWREHCDIMNNSPLGRYIEHVAGQTGHECLYFTNGSEYRPVTPNRNSARGMSVDLVIVDEALAHPLWLLSTLRPTMAQRHSADGCIGAQFVVVSNAGNDDSELLNHLQDIGQLAVQNGDDSRVWFEWSMEPGSDPLSVETWRKTIPTLDQPNGISLDFLIEESKTMRLADFMREYLCFRVNDSDDRVIDWEQWQALERSDVFVGPDPVIAIDISWDRARASIVAASGEGPYIPVEVIESREGVDWLTDRVIEVAERARCPVIVDTAGPAAAMHLILENHGIQVIPYAAKDVALSAGSFYDNVRNKRICHRGDWRLNDAVRGATKRPIGERWGFNRKGNVDISPLVSASFAVWAIDSGMVDKPMIYTG
jgi:hypothetical protein